MTDSLASGRRSSKVSNEVFEIESFPKRHPPNQFKPSSSKGLDNPGAKKRKPGPIVPVSLFLFSEAEWVGLGKRL